MVNLCALFTQCYIEQSRDNPALCMEESLNQSMITMLQSILSSHKNTNHVQFIIDEELWPKTRSFTISKVIYHYSEVLLQHAYQLYYSYIKDPVVFSACGCLSFLPLAGLFQSIIQALANNQPIAVHSILHYAYYYLKENEYQSLLFNLQEQCSPLSILRKPQDRSLQGKITQVLLKCNYIQLLCPHISISIIPLFFILIE